MLHNDQRNLIYSIHQEDVIIINMLTPELHNKWSKKNARFPACTVFLWPRCELSIFPYTLTLAIWLALPNGMKGEEAMCQFQPQTWRGIADFCLLSCVSGEVSAPAGPLVLIWWQTHNEELPDWPADLQLRPTQPNPELGSIMNNFTSTITATRFRDNPLQKITNSCLGHWNCLLQRGMFMENTKRHHQGFSEQCFYIWIPVQETL